MAEAIDLAQDLTHLLRQRQPERLDAWLQRATSSTLEALQRFARGLREHYEAVKAGVTLPWSTSPVEGHINRLKAAASCGRPVGTRPKASANRHRPRCPLRLRSPAHRQRWGGIMPPGAP